MRQIKFRAWNILEKNMINGDNLAFEEYAPLCELLQDTENQKFMHYTGIEDNNGAEIYEGDILKFNRNKKDLAKVVFGEFYVVDVETLEPVDRVIGWHYEVIPTDALSKCDRCGRLYEPETREIKGGDVNGIITMNRRMSESYCVEKFYDLCPMCLESFGKWIELEADDRDPYEIPAVDEI